MRTPSPPHELEQLLTAIRNAPSVEGIRDLVDRPDPAIQVLFAEPWVLCWLEQIFEADAILSRSPGVSTPTSEGVERPTPYATQERAQPLAPEASFFAQSLLFALSHHPETRLAGAVGELLRLHHSAEIRLAACRTIERWGCPAHAEWLREAFVDPNVNVRRRALRAVMASEPASAYQRIGAEEAREGRVTQRLSDLLMIIGRDADRRFAWERVGFREVDPRWLELALGLSKSKDRELKADAEYALLGVAKAALDEVKARVAGARPSSRATKVSAR